MVTGGSRRAHQLLAAPRPARRPRAELGDHIGAGAPAHAVANADVVMLAVPWAAIDQALEEAGSLAGKLVVDATNQYGTGPKAGRWPDCGRVQLGADARRPLRAEQDLN